MEQITDGMRDKVIIQDETEVSLAGSRMAALRPMDQSKTVLDRVEPDNSIALKSTAAVAPLIASKHKPLIEIDAELFQKYKDNIFSKLPSYLRVSDEQLSEGLNSAATKVQSRWRGARCLPSKGEPEKSLAK